MSKSADQLFFLTIFALYVFLQIKNIIVFISKRNQHIYKTTNMNVTITKENEITNVIVEGRVDTTTSHDFEKSTDSLFTDAAQQVVINCENLNYVSSSGLRVFLTLQK